MKALDAERVHETDVIVDENVEAPLVIFGHGRRLAETAAVGPHDAIASRKVGHPRIPRKRALGVAVEHQDRIGLNPRVCEVVDDVMHLKSP